MKYSQLLDHGRQNGRVTTCIFLLAFLLVAGWRLPAVAQTGPPTCDPVPTGIVAWWPAEGNANDIIGGNNGVVTGGVTYATGEVGEAFLLNATDAGITVPASGSLNVGTNGGLTLEAWIYPTALTNTAQWLLGWSGNAQSPGAMFKLSQPPSSGEGTGCLFANIIDTSGGSHYFSSAAGLVQSAVSQHVALTYSQASGVATIYLNGAIVAQQNLGAFTPETTYPFVMGTEEATPPEHAFSGLLDEVSVYNRALASSEVAAIYQAGSSGKCLLQPTPPVVFLQPSNQTVNVGSPVVLAVSASGTSPLSYQWSFNGTNLSGANNPVLTFAGAQFMNAGVYAVLVTNLYGSAVSSNAVLAVVGVPPSIASSPASETVTVGATAVFTVTAGGTPPLSYQWSVDGTNIVNATDLSLTLTNVQLSQAGNYAVLVTNAYGFVASSNAVLTVNPTSSTCDPAPTGIVAWWSAEGNANDIIGGNNGVVTGGVTYATGEVGEAFLLNATNAGITVPASGSLNVGTNGGLTLEAWIYPMALTNTAQWLLGWSRNAQSPGAMFKLSQPPSSGEGTGCLFANIIDTSGGSHYFSSAAGLVQSAVFQHVALTYSQASGVATMYLNGAIVAQQNLGAFTPETTFPFVMGTEESTPPEHAFSGLLDEVSVYNRALASSEVAAIYQAGSNGKCLPQPTAPVVFLQPSNQTVNVGSPVVLAVSASGTSPLSYQWSFNGTNIDSATNASLTLTNIQLNQAGSYAVLVSNGAGATNSVSATLTVVIPPMITQQPQSQTVVSYSSTAFTVAATGTGPLTYQWQRDGTNLVDNGNVSGSATTNLTLASVSVSDAGIYDVVVSSPYARTNSATAVLTVPETTVSMIATNAMSGSTIIMPVIMNALGVENTFLASVAYDPTKLAVNHVQLGQATAGAYLQEIDTQTNNGFVGFAILLNYGLTIPAGSQEVAEVVFQALPVTNNTTVNLMFGDTPTVQQVVDNNLNLLPAIYQGGSILLTPAEYAADVYPRFNGDHQLTIQDWLEEGRMVAGLDTATNADEFLRADCAPRNSPDGVLTVADWVQAGRYALGLDPLTLVTPPPISHATAKGQPKGGPATTRILQIANVSAQRGQSVTVPVQFVCTTNENAMGMTVSYSPNQLRFVSASLGSALTGGRLIINSNELTGKVGLALALSPGATLPAGTNQVALLQFVANTNSSGTVALALDDSVVKLQVADLLANPLAAVYVNGSVTLPAQPAVAASATGGYLQLSWPLASGTFQVQTGNSPSGPWTTVALPTFTNGANAVVTVSPTNQQQYFRLQGQ